jgi:hypothetical protein
MNKNENNNIIFKDFLFFLCRFLLLLLRCQSNDYSLSTFSVVFQKHLSSTVVDCHLVRKEERILKKKKTPEKKNEIDKKTNFNSIVFNVL